MEAAQSQAFEKAKRMNGRMPSEPQIQTLPFEADLGLGSRAKIGLIVLQTDQTIERELGSALRLDGVALYHARIPNAMDVTPETLKQMEEDLPVAAGLLPPRFKFDVIGYGCTSGATMIGEDRVEQAVRRIHPDALITDPLKACILALRTLALERVALVTPYAPRVTTYLRENLTAAGFRINAIASFNQSDDFAVAQISSRSVRQAVEEIGAREDCEGVFVSCTSLRTLPIIAEAEAHLGKPVISSNQALAWHLMRLAGVSDCLDRRGRLFRQALAQAA